jgi:hypothetical protein
MAPKEGGTDGGLPQLTWQKRPRLVSFRGVQGSTRRRFIPLFMFQVWGSGFFWDIPGVLPTTYPARPTRSNVKAQVVNHGIGIQQ